MSLDWLPRIDGLVDHDLGGDEYFSPDPPSVIYEKKAIRDPEGNAVEGLYSAWVWLNNPTQYNSYTTGMVKGVIAGMKRASMDRSVVAIVFTGVGDRAFCTGGNTKEYAEYYSRRPTEYALYMDLFNAMVDSILNAKKPVISRVNGMRVAGGQEIGAPATSPSPRIWLCLARRGRGMAPPRSVAPPISCPGTSRSKTPCGIASPARPGARTRCIARDMLARSCQCCAMRGAGCAIPV